MWWLLLVALLDVSEKSWLVRKVSSLHSSQITPDIILVKIILYQFFFLLELSISFLVLVNKLSLHLSKCKKRTPMIYGLNNQFSHINGHDDGIVQLKVLLRHILYLGPRWLASLKSWITNDSIFQLASFNGGDISLFFNIPKKKTIWTHSISDDNALTYGNHSPHWYRMLCLAITITKNSFSNV